jgi:hypothetical protein
MGIIGMAGGASRVPTFAKPLLTADLFATMVVDAENRISPTSAWDNIRLVSGGAAWADHVAVALYLKHGTAAPCKLMLYFPCDWDAAAKRFVDSGSSDWKVNPGRLANSLHAEFSAVVGRDSLHEIDDAIRRGAEIITAFRGFHPRNDALAAGVDWLLAYSWGDAEPESGGTLYTWSRFANRAQKTRVSLARLSNEP